MYGLIDWNLALWAGMGVLFACMQTDWGWAVVVNVVRDPSAQPAVTTTTTATANGAAATDEDAGASAVAAAVDPASCYVVDVLLSVDAGSVADGGAKPAAPGAA